jgi:glycine/D-amino acid oxidase-like deaminating enzyme
VSVVEINARYDLLVIGGGIDGVGIARDAAGRGRDRLPVVLRGEPLSGAAGSLLIASWPNIRLKSRRRGFPT